MCAKVPWESPIERMLYFAMLEYGLLPVCQYNIGYYRVDFAFPAEKLVVEADGKAYHRGWRVRKDKKRQEWLQKNGWRVLRFTGSTIYNDARGCARIVKRWLKDK
jgi:very-short-patch-repair endonuclease